MRVQIKATNIELTPSIKDYVEKKLGSLEKYFTAEEDPLVSVEVGKTSKHHKSGDVFRAEIRVVHKGEDCYAWTEKDDLYAAIDEVKDEVVREIVSYKKRAKDLIRRGGAKVKSLIKRLTW